MNIVYLALGSNVGERKANINAAEILINNEIGLILHTSSMYETDPQGFVSFNRFLNNVMCIKTFLSALEVLSKIEIIEKEIGRNTKSIDGRYHDRLIDIDILYYNQEVILLDNLTIPHPQLHHRLFVLEPLTEIAPNFAHPIFRLTSQEMLDKLLNVNE